MHASTLIARVAFTSLAIVATACGDVSPTADNGPDLDFGPDTWVLVDGSSDGSTIEAPEGFRIDLRRQESFDDIAGTAACNQYFGSVFIDGSSVLFTDLGQTEMACSPQTAMDAEAAYLAALGRVTAGTRTSDTLTLTGSEDTSLRFERSEPVPTAELFGTTWEWDTLVSGDAASTVGGDPVTLVLDEDGTFTTGTGCRTLSGSYVVAGDRLQFPSMSADGDCTSELTTQDEHVTEVFESGVRVTVDGNRLTLMTTSGKGLGYRAA